MTNELADLEHALDLALKVDFALVPVAGKEDDLLSVTRIRNKVDVLDHRVLMPFDTAQQHRAQGHTSPVGWMEHNTHTHGDDAARRRRFSRRVRHHPRAEAAMAAGEITARHIDVLDKARRAVGDDAYRIAEQVLVDTAVTKRFEDFARTIDYFIARARPDDPEKREQDQIRDRWASSSRTLDGCGQVDAWLPPLAFTVFDDELRRLTEALYQQDVAEARDRLGRAPLPEELARDARQRRADALVLMAQRSAAHGDDQVPKSRFVINLHAGAGLMLQVLERLIAALRDGGDDEIDLEGISIGPEDLCEDDAGNLITVNTLVLAILTGKVRGYLYDPDGVPLRYGRARDLFAKDQADSLRARYRRCAHPYGCGHTGHRLQSNHITDAATAGPPMSRTAIPAVDRTTAGTPTPSGDPHPTEPWTGTNEDSRPTSGRWTSPNSPHPPSDGPTSAAATAGPTDRRLRKVSGLALALAVRGSSARA